MFNTKDVDIVMISSSPVALNAVAGSTPDTLNSGEIGLFTPEGVRILGANAAAQSKFKFALNDAGNIIVSDIIDKATITQLVTKQGQVDQEAIDYIGYNGSTGDIEAIADNNYNATVYIEELFTATKDSKYTKSFRTSTGATPVKHDIVQELAKDAIRNLGIRARDPNPLFKAEVVSAGASSTVATGSGTFIFTKGSKFFSATDIDNSTGGAALIPGTFIRTSNSLTAGIYKIVDVDATNNIGTLDIVYQDPSAIIANAVLRQVTAAAFAAAAVGLKLTGIPIPFNLARVGRQRFAKNIWNIGLREFGNTLYTQAQGANRGVNAMPSVAEKEYFTQGFEFGDNKYEVDNGSPVLFDNRRLVSGAFPYYNSITLRFEDRLLGAWKNDISPKELTIFSPSTDPAFMSTATNGLRAVLATMTGVAVPNPV